MALKSTDVKVKSDALESKLQGKRFLGGDKPSADDVKEFEALLGAGNLGLFRWVKHMASFSQAERSAWGAPVKPAKAPAGTPAPGAAAAAATSSKPAADASAKAPAAKVAAKAAAKPAAKKPAADDDDEVDLFGEESAEEAAAREKTMADKKASDAAAKDKKKKEAPIAKSSILMDIKPFDDTTDLEALVGKIKAIEKDGLLWGAHKLVPVAYGVKKLQLLIVIEDDKVSGDDLEDMISQFEDEVQSMDIVAWNKV